MDVTGYVASIQILNLDVDESTINMNEFIFQQQINCKSYIVSDADEELLILIGFKQIVNLKAIKIYTYTLDIDHDNISQPKMINIYKINNLNKDFNDIAALQPDKSIICSVKKLQTGQKIKLKQNSKNAVKFNKIQCIAIYIQSNQDNTEKTYVNGITFHGENVFYKIMNNNYYNKQYNTEHSLFNTMDASNCKKLRELVTEINNINLKKKNRIDSDYLYDACNLYNKGRIQLRNQCMFSECESLKMMSAVLKRYNVFIEKKQNNDNLLSNAGRMIGGLEEVYDDDYGNVDLLNDFCHLLMCHYNEFEEIYKRLIGECNGNEVCDLSQCLLLRRNNRDRTRISNDEQILKELYFDYDSIVQQQLLDKIHCYYFHSFDIGHKLTKKEKQQFVVDDQESKVMDINDIELLEYDVNAAQIQNIIQSKKTVCRNVNGLERLYNPNNKFVIKQDEAHNNLNQYSFGFRFFYWEYYKTAVTENDPVHNSYNLQIGTQSTSNIGSSMNEWYIAPKYDSLKQEVISNEICAINVCQWNSLEKLAEIHLQSETAKEIYCPRKESARYYEMRYNDPIQEEHLIAMMIYCNFDELQFKFSETFRRMDKNESDESVKLRHSNYYFLGKLLRESVECFGTKYIASDDDNDNDDNICVYHGITKFFTFSSLYATIKGPLSTTTDFCVAANFSQQKGMILQINVYAPEWRFNWKEGKDSLDRITLFDCSWLSDYISEQEILCIGGLNTFIFKTIIDTVSNINYERYLKGIKQMTYCMSNGNWNNEYKNIASTIEEKQIMFRLLSHEFHRYYPNHQHAQQYKSCPIYIKNILHSHCQSIKFIKFMNRDNNKESKLHELFFKYDYGFIKLQLIVMIFPNIKTIAFDASKMNINFLKQSSIYNSILNFIYQNEKNHYSLQFIQIEINIKQKQEINAYIKQYENEFNKYSWNIYIHQINNMYQGMTVSNKSKSRCSILIHK